MNKTINSAKTSLLLLSMVVFAASCSYQNVGKADYPEQLIYLPAAVNGIFSISSVATSGASRYVVELDAKKFTIPLGVSRSGKDLDGDFPVSIVANPDTVSKLIAANKLTGTDVLPVDKFTVPATVTMGNGQNNAPFNLSIDLDFLRNNPTRKFAIGVSVASTQRKTTPNLGTVVVLVDPALLKPVPNFTSKADATLPRKITFTNTSANSVTYAWDFGNGSPVSTESAPTYTYMAAGTYTVTLTAIGITGAAEAIKKTGTVTVP